MNTRILLAALALIASDRFIIAADSPPPGGNVVRVLHWSEVPTPSEASVNRAGHNGADTLLIKHIEAKPAKIALWNVENPGVKTKAYAVRGKVRYKNVVGISYLETWNEFPGGNEPDEPKIRAFSRALAEDGPFSKMTGTSDWRDVFIPFNAEGAKEPLTKLELNLVLAGAGEVEVTDLQLIEFADSGAMWAALGPGMAKANTAVSWAIWLAVGAVAVSIIGVVLVLRLVSASQHRKAEQRRMKALDVE
jgi:hypothetical protein